MLGFIVDAASLDRVGHRLGLLHGQLESAPEIIGGYDAAMFGGAALQEELDGFAHQWRHEMTTVGGELDLMQMRLTDASAAYRQIENRHRALAHAAGASGSGTTVIDPGASQRVATAGSGVGSGTTVIDGGTSAHSAPAPSGHRPGTGSGTTVIGGLGSGNGNGSGASGSGTTVVGSTRQPVDAGSAGSSASGFSAPLGNGENGLAPGR